MVHTDTKVHTHSSNTINRYDPTHTTTIRNDFSREMRKRFDKLRGVIRRTIIDYDCFGLMQKNEGITALAEMSPPGNAAFAFTRSADKVEAFMEWLQEQYKKGILEVYDHEQLGMPMEEPWTNKYVRRAYVKGVSTAHGKMIQAGYKNVLPIEKMGGIDAVMNAPFHVDRVGLMYTRVFNELKGITSAMDQQLSRILAQSMAEGKGPIEMARILNKTIAGPVGGLGITDTLGRFIPARRRAEILARTEVIRAHHQATIQEYRNWGAVGVIVKAEWTTAGDSKVCSKCAGFEGNEYTLDEIEGMIPAHPNCRCIALPVDVTDKEGKEVEGLFAEEQTEKAPKDPREILHEKYYKYKSDDSWIEEATRDIDTDNWEVEKVVTEIQGRKYVGLKFTNKNFEPPGKGFQTFYHDTNRTNVPSIAEKGLLEDYGNRRWGPGGTWANKSKHLMANDDATIEIKAPKGFFEKDPDGRGWVAYEDIPPKWIKSYTMFRDAELDYKNLKMIPKPIPEDVLDFFRLPTVTKEVVEESLEEFDASVIGTKLRDPKYREELRQEALKGNKVVVSTKLDELVQHAEKYVVEEPTTMYVGLPKGGKYVQYDEFGQEIYVFTDLTRASRTLEKAQKYAGKNGVVIEVQSRGRSILIPGNAFGLGDDFVLLPSTRIQLEKEAGEGFLKAYLSDDGGWWIKEAKKFQKEIDDLAKLGPTLKQSDDIVPRWIYTEDLDKIQQRLEDLGVGETYFRGFQQLAVEAINDPNEYYTAKALLSHYNLHEKLTQVKIQKMMRSLNSFAEELTIMYSKYPKLYDKMMKAKLKGNTLDSVTFLWDDIFDFEGSMRLRGVYVNRFSTSGEKSIRLATGNIVDKRPNVFGAFTVSGDPEFSHLVRHEFGHHVQMVGLTEKQLDEWIKIWDGYGPKLFKEVSIYAASSQQEAFAECFAAFMNSMYKDGPKLPSVIEKYFNSVFGGQATKTGWAKYTTLDEVVDVLEKKLKIHKPTYVGKSTEATKEKIMIERIKLIGERLTEASDKHPGLARLIREMPTGKGVNLTFTKGKYVLADDGDMARAVYDWKQSSINISLAHNIKGQTLHKIGRKTTFTVGDDFLSIFMHEYGHHIHLSNALNVARRLTWNSLWKEYGSEWFKANVSQYAGSDIREAFAESFCAYMSPDYGVGGNRLPKVIEDFMKEAFD